MHISFILVDPVVPENVGFCIRGLTTMGFTDLRIVGMPLHLEQGARNTAYGSHELLGKVQTFPSLNDAVADCELVVGTTAKTRITRYDRLNPEQLRVVLEDKPADLKVGLVFGSETNGLSRADIDQCDLLTSIPLKTAYPSLNLAQAVMVYAYELGSENKDDIISMPSRGLIKSLKVEANELLELLGYDRHPIKKQRIMDRLMLLSEKDSELITGVLKSLKRKLK